MESELNKKIFANNLKKHMKESGKTRLDICNALEIPYMTLSDWINAKNYPRIDKIEKLANYFGIKKADLIEDDYSAESLYDRFDNIMPIKTQRVPLLGKIACGEPIYADEDRESYIEVGTDIKADFCLRARGDSMIGARIQDGDIVFIRNQPMVDNGEIAAVIIEDEATLKRVFFYREESKLILNPENSKYPPLVYIGEQLKNIRILGKAIAFQSDL